MRLFGLLLSVVILHFSPDLNAQGVARDPVEALKEVSAAVDTSLFASLPVQNRGRLKPLNTLARESVLFILGKYSNWGLDSVQIYMGLIVTPNIEPLEIINVRQTNIRTALGFASGRRYFSLAEVEKSPLNQLAGPLLEKEEAKPRSLEPEEKALIEVYNQYWFLKQIHSGNHFLQSLVFSEKAKGGDGHGQGEAQVLSLGKELLRALSSGNKTDTRQKLQALKSGIHQQQMPSALKEQLSRIELEVSYTNWHPFFIAAVLFLLLGLALFVEGSRKFLVSKRGRWLFVLPFIPLLLGFAARVYITGFAPVTNMYGTMVWVAFGIGLFSLVLLFLYNNYVVVGSLWISSSAFLFLTESIPLVLSPDMDPIVAVLRSNLWLTIHVLTIVVSYACFAITMVLGNIVVIRSLIKGEYKSTLIADYAKSTYRMIQLGVFLLTAGIILGGVWADYSWGRFWGWDPKETWSLIADIGYLAILHARHVGWLSPFGLMMASPLAFLLVIMAWYGVNFILAAGLHSYGFSSGGAALVLTFTVIQVGLLIAAVLVRFYRERGAKS